jgi:hypothetical protein
MSPFEISPLRFMALTPTFRGSACSSVIPLGALLIQNWQNRTATVATPAPTSEETPVRLARTASKVFEISNLRDPELIVYTGLILQDFPRTLAKVVSALTFCFPHAGMVSILTALTTSRILVRNFLKFLSMMLIMNSSLAQEWPCQLP